MYPSRQHSSRLCLSVCYRVYCSRQTNPPHFRLCAQPPKSHTTVVSLSPLSPRNTICIVRRTQHLRPVWMSECLSPGDAFSCKMFILISLYPEITKPNMVNKFKNTYLVKHNRVIKSGSSVNSTPSLHFADTMTMDNHCTSHCTHCCGSL